MKRIKLLLVLAIVAGGCRFFKGDPYRNTPTTGITAISTDETFRPIIESELDVFKAIYGYTEFKANYVPEVTALTSSLMERFN